MDFQTIATKTCNAAWLIMAAYWFYGILKTGRSAREAPADRLKHTLPMVLGLFLLFDSKFGRGFLGERFVPLNNAILVIGCALTIAGVALAIWARYHLGQNWSGEVIIQADHQLIETGPYALLRHPIYTGIILAAIGSALVGVGSGGHWQRWF